MLFLFTLKIIKLVVKAFLKVLLLPVKVVKLATGMSSSGDDLLDDETRGADTTTGRESRTRSAERGSSGDARQPAGGTAAAEARENLQRFQYALYAFAGLWGLLSLVAGGGAELVVGLLYAAGFAAAGAQAPESKGAWYLGMGMCLLSILSLVTIIGFYFGYQGRHAVGEGPMPTESTRPAAQSAAEAAGTGGGTSRSPRREQPAGAEPADEPAAAAGAAAEPEAADPTRESDATPDATADADPDPDAASEPPAASDSGGAVAAVAEPTLAWETRAAPSLSNAGVAVADGTVFAATGDRVVALDAESGEQAWAFDADALVTTGTPAVADGWCYAGSESGKVYALDADTGDRRWTLPYRAFDAVWTTPAVGDAVYVGSDDERVYALDPDRGTDEWSYAAGASVRAPLAAIDGGVYGVSDAGSAFALDAASGDEQWSAAVGGAGVGVAAVGSVVAVGTEGGVTGLHVDSGDRAWQVDGAITSMTATDRAIVAGRADGSVAILDPSSGEQAWTTEFDADPFVAVRDGSLYVAAGRTLAAFAADGSRQWTVELDRPAAAAPAVDADRVVVRSTDGTVYGFDRA